MGKPDVPIVDRRVFPIDTERRVPLAVATFVLGLTLFALFFGLVAACDRL